MPIKPSKHTGVEEYSHSQIVNYMMTQYLLTKVLKKFKKVGEAEFEKYLNQLHMKSNFDPMDVANMSEKQKEDALESLMLLKEKRNGLVPYDTVHLSHITAGL